MEIYERINIIVTAFKKLNGYNPDYFEPLAHDLHDVYLPMNGKVVQVLGVAFNDLINNNLSITINHPSFRFYPVCLKLHIGRKDDKLGWHDEFVKKQAEDAVGEGITPEEVLDCIQNAVASALSSFVRETYTEWRKMEKIPKKA